MEDPDRFGDSYADTGFAPGGVLRLPPFNFPCPNGPPLAPTCRFTGGTTFVDSLQAIYHLPQATNYAFGGARTDTTNTTSIARLPRARLRAGTRHPRRQRHAVHQ